MQERRLRESAAGLRNISARIPRWYGVIWLILTFALPPAGIIGYIAAWIVMPKESDVVALAPAAVDL